MQIVGVFIDHFLDIVVGVIHEIVHVEQDQGDYMVDFLDLKHAFLISFLDRRELKTHSFVKKLNRVNIVDQKGEIIDDIAGTLDEFKSLRDFLIIFMTLNQIQRIDQ